MAINATAVLTTELDSSKINSQIAKLVAGLGAIPQQVISQAKLESGQVIKQVNEIRDSFRSIETIRIKPTADFSAIKVPTTTVVSQATEEVRKAGEKLQTSLANIKNSIEELNAAQKQFLPTRLTRNLITIEKQTQSTRDEIRKNFKDVEGSFKNLGASTEQIKGIRQVNRTLQNLAGGSEGVDKAFRDTLGRINKGDLGGFTASLNTALKGAQAEFNKIFSQIGRAASGRVAGLEKIPAKISQEISKAKPTVTATVNVKPTLAIKGVEEEVKKGIGNINDTVAKASASRITKSLNSAISSFRTSFAGVTKGLFSSIVRPTDRTQLKNVSKQIESSISGAKVDAPVKLNLRPDLNTAEARNILLRGLDNLVKVNARFARTEFVERFEWDQAAKATVAEAQAAFSRESVFRRIFSGIFTGNKAAGAVGFFVGKIIETAAGIIKSSVTRLITLVQGAKSLITVTIGSIFAAPFALAGKALPGIIGGFFTGVSSLIRKAFGAVAFLIRAQGAIFNTAVVAVFSTVQAIVNKISVSVLFAITSQSVKTVAKAFLSLGRLVIAGARRLKNTISSALRGIFSGFGLFGGGRGGGGILGGAGGLGGGAGGDDGFNFSQLLGIGALGVTIKLAADFEVQLLKISQITGQVGNSLKKTGQDIINLSNDFATSASTIAKAVFDISSSGFRGADSLLVLQASLVASKAGFGDVSNAASTVSRILNAFNLGAFESAKVADILFTTVKRGNVGALQPFAAGLTRVTAIANSAGVSFEEVSAIIANLTRNGQLSNSAITGLGAILRSIVGPTDTAKETLEDLSIDLTEARVRSEGLIAVFQDIAPAILANKGAFRRIFGDVSALKSALVLSQSIAVDPTGETSLARDLEAAKQRGAAFEAAAKTAISFNQQIQKFLTNFSNILRNIGQALLPAARSGIELVARFTGEIADFANRDFSGFVRELRSSAGEIFSAIVGLGQAVFDLLILEATNVGRFFSTTFGAILEGTGTAAISFFGSLIGKVLDVGIVAIREGIALILESVSDIIPGGVRGLDILAESLREANEQILRVGLFDTSGTFDNFGSVFDKALEKGLSASQLDNTQAKQNIVDAFFRIGDTIRRAGASLSNKSSAGLREQAEGLTELIDSLTKQAKDELARGEIERAEITNQFLSQEKKRLKQITAQVSTSELREQLDKQRQLFEDLEVFRRKGFTELQQRTIARLQTNFLDIRDLEAIEAKKRLAMQKSNSSSQISTIERLEKSIRALLKSTDGSIKGLGTLSSVLDEIFGKDLERISKKFGVGKDLASLRSLSKDVILAKGAGFTDQDVDTIIVRGLIQQSDLLTKIFSVFAQTRKKLDVTELRKLGVFDDTVTLLDRAAALGLSDTARRQIFRGAIDQSTIAQIDTLSTAGDRETGLINQAFRQFQNIDKARKLQERRNTAQDKLNEISKNSFNALAEEERKVVQIEALVVELQTQQARQNRVAATATGG